MEYLLTIVTPTYNRKGKIRELYESLVSQTKKDFIWMVIDDGSTDGTRDCIQHYISEGRLKIEYLYKENHGKHSALNIAFEKVSTELLFIVDSDDTLVETAVASIYEDYHLIEEKEYACLVYLRGNPEGKPIGGSFPREGSISYIDILHKLGHKEDKAEVWKTECLREFRFPEYDNEVFVGEAYVWAQVGERYSFYLRNIVIYLCEYLRDGLTRSGRAFRMQNPYGGMAHADVHMKSIYPPKIRLKNTLLFVVYGYCAGLSVQQIIKKSNAPKLTKKMLLPGMLLYKYWKNKYLA